MGSANCSCFLFLVHKLLLFLFLFQVINTQNLKCIFYEIARKRFSSQIAEFFEVQVLKCFLYLLETLSELCEKLKLVVLFKILCKNLMGSNIFFSYLEEKYILKDKQRILDNMKSFLNLSGGK